MAFCVFSSCSVNIITARAFSLCSFLLSLVHYICFFGTSFTMRTNYKFCMRQNKFYLLQSLYEYIVFCLPRLSDVFRENVRFLKGNFCEAICENRPGTRGFSFLHLNFNSEYYCFACSPLRRRCISVSPQFGMVIRYKCLSPREMGFQFA